MKIIVRVNNGTLAGRTYELTSGFLSIGRGETCSIRFDPNTERIASKQHAFIEAKADGFYIRDNQSTNGTFINGERADTVKLNDGDTIEFGRGGATATVQINEMGSASAIEHHRFEINADAGPQSLQQSFANLALGRPPAVKPEPSKAGKYIGIAFAIFVMLFMAFVVLLITVASVGVGTAIIAAVVAFVPATLYLLPFMWLDRYDPEPLWLLALAFAWGAIISVVFSFFANTIFEIGLMVAINPEAGETLGAVAVAPIFEEGSKGLGLIILLVFFRKYFDDILDGIVFAGVIALGFATVENVLYYGRAINKGGMALLAFLFILRGVLGPFAHATFTAMTGIGCGVARESHNKLVRFFMPLIGYVAAVSLHATWNTIATFCVAIVKQLDIGFMCVYFGLDEDGLCAYLLTYAILEVPLFCIFFFFALYVMRRQNKILREMLALDVARGLITEDTMKKATSAFRSSAWLFGGIFAGKYKARTRFVRAVGKLGLSYWHIQRATAAQGQTASFQQNPILREEVLKWRELV
jgi:RsiW-degrading membrane proteinase PrsW (M82 family)